MLGENELELSHDEVCAALAFYLNKVVFQRPVKISELRSQTDVYGSSPKNTYRVRMTIKFTDVHSDAEAMPLSTAGQDERIENVVGL